MNQAKKSIWHHHRGTAHSTINEELGCKRGYTVQATSIQGVSYTGRTDIALSKSKDVSNIVTLKIL